MSNLDIVLLRLKQSMPFFKNPDGSWWMTESI